MKIRFFLKGALSLLIALICVYAGRVGTLWLLAQLFQKTNLNADTYARAGGALRFLADRADIIATAVGLLLAIAAGLFMKDRFPGEEKTVKATALMRLLEGLVIGFLGISLLAAMDAVRKPLVRGFGTWDKWLMCLILCIARAVVLRGCCVKAVKSSRIAALTVSALLDGAFFLFVYGEGKDILACVNGILTGAFLAEVYLENASLWPEICFSFGFTAGHRFLGGLGEGGLYSVGEGILTGSGRGIECSLYLTILYAVMICIVIFGLIYGKKHHGRQETPVHR